MSQIIYKYPILIGDAGAQDITLPRGARILTVQAQYNEPQMWVLVNPSSDVRLEMRRFIAYPTAYPFEIESDKELVHIGTFQLYGGGLVYHLFEEVEKGREKRI